VWQARNPQSLTVTTAAGETLALDGELPLGYSQCQGGDWSPLQYSAASPVPKELVVVRDSTAKGGCDASDYAPPDGVEWVAVTTSNATCNVYVKALAAQTAGAAAIIIHRTTPSSTLVGGRVRCSFFEQNFAAPPAIEYRCWGLVPCRTCDPIACLSGVCTYRLTP